MEERRWKDREGEERGREGEERRREEGRSEGGKEARRVELTMLLTHLLACP